MHPTRPTEPASCFVVNYVKSLRLLICLLAASTALGGTSGISFVYQPLTTLGTDSEARIVVAKVPIIVSGPPESVLVYISAPAQLLQRGPAIIEDSNLLSRLGISINGEAGPERGYYVATLDLSQVKRTAQYGVTDEDVVRVALRCIRSTINEVGQKGIWKIRIIGRQLDGGKWHKYETEYRPHPKI
jgi:hypothetical protein